TRPEIELTVRRQDGHLRSAEAAVVVDAVVADAGVTVVPAGAARMLIGLAERSLGVPETAGAPQARGRFSMLFDDGGRGREARGLRDVEYGAVETGIGGCLRPLAVLQAGDGPRPLVDAWITECDVLVLHEDLSGRLEEGDLEGPCAYRR